MKTTKTVLIINVVFLMLAACNTAEKLIKIDQLPYVIYPGVNKDRPKLPSPFKGNNGHEYVLAVTNEKQFAIIPVTLSNEREICLQLIVDIRDFPELATTGLHSEESLSRIKTITGRSIEKITELGLPGGLSQSGFLAKDEDIISVLKADNRIVQKMGFTHPQLAKPLFHVLNMMDADLTLDRWNMARHKWENISCFYYNNQKVFVEAEDTKGGQQSIFDDQIEGGFHIKLWREFKEKEIQFLLKKYGQLPPEAFGALKTLLSTMNIGEMEPQYIMRYGFYEGHTYWRADPVAISFIFGLKTLEELDAAFDGKLYEVLTEYFVK